MKQEALKWAGFKNNALHNVLVMTIRAGQSLKAVGGWSLAINEI